MEGLEAQFCYVSFLTVFVYKLKDINDSDRTCQNQEQALSYEGGNVIMYVSEEK